MTADPNLKTPDGKPAAGVCYPCQGKGYMTQADDRRTTRYWLHRFSEGC